MVGGFVEQQQVAALQERAGDVETHAPAAGEGGDGLFLIRWRKAETMQQLCCACLRRIAVDHRHAVVQLGELLNVGVGGVHLQPFFDELELGFECPQLLVTVERVFHRRLLQRRGVLADRRDDQVARQIDGAAVRHQFAADGGEQRRLADAVLADHADALVGMDDDGNVFEQRLDVATQREVLESEHGVQRKEARFYAAPLASAVWLKALG